jgi:hypothetical protein
MDDSERRAAPRKRTLKGGRIAFNAGQSTIECVIRNLSETGAKLHVSSVIGIPPTFELLLSDNSRRKCRVVWRSLQEMGVTFEL